jgi:hypothetical protein
VTAGDLHPGHRVTLNVAFPGEWPPDLRVVTIARRLDTDIPGCVRFEVTDPVTSKRWDFTFTTDHTVETVG